MAIEKMNAFTILAPLAAKAELLKRFQRFENVHFKNLGDAAGTDEALAFLEKDHSPEAVSALEEQLAKARYALTAIAPYADKPKGLKAMTTPSPTLQWDEFEGYAESSGWGRVYGAAHSAAAGLEALKQEKDRLLAESAGLSQWKPLDVSLSELDRLRAVKAVFGGVNRSARDAFLAGLSDNFPRVYAENAAETREGPVLLALIPRNEYDETLAWMKVNGFSQQTPAFAGVPAETMLANAERVSAIEAEEESVKAELKALAAERVKLETAADCFETRLERERARHNFLKSKTALVLEGWVPADVSHEFGAALADVCGGDYYLEESPADRDGDDVPVKLRNNRVVAPFESITAMYSVPRYNEIDPTPVITPFYMIFFAIMIGDAGFGLILLLGSLTALKFFNLKEGGRKFMRFFFWLSIPTVLMGFVYGSLFGFTFFAPIKTADGYKAIIDTQLDIVTMIVASIAIGAFQVLFGVAVKGYMLIKSGHPLAAISDSLLWITSVLGGIGLILAMAGVLDKGWQSICLWGMVISLIGLACTQGRDAKTPVGKAASGLYAVYGITGYVGDLVSYTRLMALSLSGAYIGFSFIKIAQLFTGPMYWTFGLLIIIMGQALNLGLSALGAYVHTCRLQFVEFFGKFYGGGGVAFKPLKPKNTYVKINKIGG